MNSNEYYKALRGNKYLYYQLAIYIIQSAVSETHPCVFRVCGWPAFAPKPLN